jgi:HEPN domain-containing protein
VNAERWYTQAEADLRAAEASRDSGHYEWACFQAQQAAEKALKSFLYARGRTSIATHLLTRLVDEAAKLEQRFAHLKDDARLLDQFYIPTRYPNGLPDPAVPATFYTLEDAERCIQSARSILSASKRPGPP